MDSPGEILNLCRLCLVKDQVNIPIFEEQGDIRQIFLKISSCLPVTITRHDQLPKRICDACSNKLDLLYEFWNSSASAEKTLLSWLGQAGVEDAGEKISAVAQQIAKPAETLVKEESEALDESNLINESRDSFEDQSIDDEGTKDEAEAPPPKRARRTAAVKAQINITPESDEDEDDDFDAGEAMTKMEDESEESESDMKDDPSYSELPGTSADDQAGPSGVGKDGVEAPSNGTCSPIDEEQEWEEAEKTNWPTCDHDYVKHAPDVTPTQDKIIIIEEEEMKKDTRSRNTEKVCYQCEFCDKILKSERFLDFHIRGIHLKKFNLYCEMCGKGFLRLSVLNKHKQLMHETGRAINRLTFPCSEEGCDKIYARKASLINHLKTVHRICPPDGPPSYTCQICQKVVLSRGNLQIHIRTHTGEKPFKCDLCEKAYHAKRYLQWHIQNAHNKEEIVMCQCEKCGKILKSIHSLKMHMKVVHIKSHGEYCELCGKGFSCLSGLNRHKMLTHDKGKDVVKKVNAKVRCSVEGCGRVYHGKTSLIYHQKTRHSICPPNEPLSYTCAICQKVFLARANLVIHERKHTGERPFKCEKCERTFIAKKYLKEHYVVHTKEKRFVCKFCDKKFAQGSTLSVHVKKCHPEYSKKR